MSCEVCGRGACVPSFHSIDEQQSFDEVADLVKDRAKECISHRINRLDTEWVDNECYVKLEDALGVVDDYC
jgi:hypothetical protein